MKKLEIDKAKASLSQYARRLRKEPVILLDEGKPVAALLSLRRSDWETIALSMNPRFIRLIEQSRKSYKELGGLSSEEMKARLKRKN